MMGRTGRFISVSVAMLSVLTACVHQFPDLSTPADIILNIHFDTEFHGQTDVDVFEDASPSVSERESTGYVRDLDGDFCDLRGTVRLFRQKGSGTYDFSYPDYEIVVSEDDPDLSDISVSLSVAEGNYMVGVWLDLVEEGSVEDLHYNTSDMRAVTHASSYIGSTDSRDAFTGTMPLEVIRYGRSDRRNIYHMDVERPFAKFVIIANDLEEFITKTLYMKIQEKLQSGEYTEEDTKSALLQSVDLNEYEVRFRYFSDGLDDNFGTSKPDLYDLPSVYDVMKGLPTGSVSGAGFTSSIERLDGGKACLGFDYVYPSQGNTYVSVGVYDKKGTQMAQTPSIQVPLTRNGVTQVSGNFLMQNVSGGTVIDPEFSGDHDYEIK